MIRYFVVLRRAAHIDRTAFLHAWLVDHRALAETLPGVREVCFQPTVDPDSAIDGVGYLGFESIEDLEAALATDVARRLREHTSTFSDEGSTLRIVVDAEPDGGTR